MSFQDGHQPIFLSSIQIFWDPKRYLWQIKHLHNEMWNVFTLRWWYSSMLELQRLVLFRITAKLLMSRFTPPLKAFKSQRLLMTWTDTSRCTTSGITPINSGFLSTDCLRQHHSHTAVSKNSIGSLLFTCGYTSYRYLAKNNWIPPVHSSSMTRRPIMPNNPSQQKLSGSLEVPMVAFHITYRGRTQTAGCRGNTTHAEFKMSNANPFEVKWGWKITKCLMNWSAYEILPCH